MMIKENIEKKLADFKERHEYHCDEIKSHKSLRDHYRRKIEKLEAILTDKANIVCTGCIRKQNLIEMLRVKKTKTTYKIVCPYCGSDKYKRLNR